MLWSFTNYEFDFHRGLFQGVTDNRVTLHEFALLLERKTKGCHDEADDVAASYPSLLGVFSKGIMKFFSATFGKNKQT